MKPASTNPLVQPLLEHIERLAQAREEHEELHATVDAAYPEGPPPEVQSLVLLSEVVLILRRIDERLVSIELTVGRNRP